MIAGIVGAVRALFGVLGKALAIYQREEAKRVGRTEAERDALIEARKVEDAADDARQRVRSDPAERERLRRKYRRD